MPLPTEILIHLVVTVVPFCHQIPFSANLYSCLSDRKSFSENPFVYQYKLYRHLATLCPYLLKVFSLLSFSPWGNRVLSLRLGVAEKFPKIP
ncbi:MAG: hypothetical protein NZ805_00725 [Armatimonadetes bacterium]|nr:hypothetical protein [Armatimonadota bacterium]